MASQYSPVNWEHSRPIPMEGFTLLEIRGEGGVGSKWSRGSHLSPQPTAGVFCFLLQFQLSMTEHGKFWVP